MTKPEFLDEPPMADSVTAYDRAHLPTYLRLLDAEGEGTDWQEVYRIVFGNDPAGSPGEALRTYRSHLARAHWMMRSGYRQLRYPSE